MALFTVGVAPARKRTLSSLASVTIQISDQAAREPDARPLSWPTDNAISVRSSSWQTGLFSNTITQRRSWALSRFFPLKAKPTSFASPDGTFRLLRPTYSAFKRAAQAWFDRGASFEANRLIFHFCGHGFGYGTETSLLLSDFDFRRGRSLGLRHRSRHFPRWHGSLCRRGANLHDRCLSSASRGPRCAKCSDRPVSDPPPSESAGEILQPGETRQSSFPPVMIGRREGARMEPAYSLKPFLRAVQGMARHRDDYGDWRVKISSRF